VPPLLLGLARKEDQLRLLATGWLSRLMWTEEREGDGIKIKGARAYLGNW
jgi:hypothetical protein